MNHPMITSMREHKGYLYLGGIYNNRIGRYKIPGADPNWTGAGRLLGQAVDDRGLSSAPTPHFAGSTTRPVAVPLMDGPLRPNARARRCAASL